MTSKYTITYGRVDEENRVYKYTDVVDAPTIIHALSIAIEVGKSEKLTVEKVQPNE
jgi:hypothetical protein